MCQTHIAPLTFYFLQFQWNALISTNIVVRVLWILLMSLMEQTQAQILRQDCMEMLDSPPPRNCILYSFLPHYSIGKLLINPYK